MENNLLLEKVSKMISNKDINKIAGQLKFNKRKKYKISATNFFWNICLLSIQDKYISFLQIASNLSLIINHTTVSKVAVYKRMSPKSVALFQGGSKRLEAFG